MSPLILFVIFFDHIPNTIGLFEDCNHFLNLKCNEKIYITSPRYPAQYSIGSSCRYDVKAPVEHSLKFTCSINLTKHATASRCSNEIFYFNQQGSEILSDSDYFCGSGVIERKSFLNRAVISYISSSGQDKEKEILGAREAGGRSFSCFVEVVESPCDCGWSSTGKVAGNAYKATIDEFPPMAGVLSLKYNRIFCGASIIHHRYLLSAAHCFFSAETNRSQDIEVIVGEQDLSTAYESFYTKRFTIERIIVHEQYRTTATFARNDIALLRTAVDMEWSRAVGPACLPFVSLYNEEKNRFPSAMENIDVLGWGTTSFGGQQSTHLLKTSLDVISMDECKKYYSMMAVEGVGQFCTYTPGRDACQYDSGGALYVRQNGRLFAMGIVSFGVTCASIKPSVNTKIATYLRWIIAKASNTKFCQKF